MPLQELGLPISIPWKVIAASDDMMDTVFCNKQFPFAWRSSIAVSVFEPAIEDLPEAMCDRRITYLKVACTITGYQPSKAETMQAAVAFGDLPTEEMQRLVGQYWGCYGVQLNVAVFPARRVMQREVRHRVDFAAFAPGSEIGNPYQRQGFEFSSPRGSVLSIVALRPPQAGAERSPGELAIRGEVSVTVPTASRVIAKLYSSSAQAESGSTSATGRRELSIDVSALRPNARAGLSAYQGSTLIATQRIGAQTDRLYELTVDGDRIDRVVLHSDGQTVSLIEIVALSSVSVPVRLDDYPRVTDFEPKLRDFYQTASEDGEILTASGSTVHTDKSFAHTQSTETGLSLSGTVGYAAGDQGGLFGSLTGGLSHKWGETTQDVSTTQTDASRERRERFATSTSLSQMYNLLTGYHIGTNRAVFLLLPRPHVMQPTDRRSFVRGLRVIEGVQEFFLVVSRQRELDAICFEAYLETGHFPEDVVEETITRPPDQRVDQYVLPLERIDRPDVCFGSCGYRQVGDAAGYVVEAPLGWIFDRSFGGGSGVTLSANNSDDWLRGGDGDDAADWIADGRPGRPHFEWSAQLSGEKTVTIRVTVRPEAGGGSHYINLIFDLHYIEENPPAPETRVRTPFLLTSRGLCACIQSGEHCPQKIEIGEPVADPPEEVEPVAPADASGHDVPPATGSPPTVPVISIVPMAAAESVVDERTLDVRVRGRRDGGPHDPRTPAMKELIEKVRSTMTSSWRSPSRSPRGVVGFLQTDYFADRARKLLPERILQTPLAEVRNLPAELLAALGDKETVAQTLELPLADLARRAGCSLELARNLRLRLMGIQVEPRVERDSRRGQRPLV